MPSPSYCTRRTCGRGARPGYTGCFQAWLSTYWYRSFVRSGGCFGEEPARSPTPPKTSVFADLAFAHTPRRPLRPPPLLSRIACMQSRSNRPSPPGWPPRAAQPRTTPSSHGQRQADQYDSFHASLLYCGVCRQATPTRQRLLLVLPTGNLYEYLCAQCGTSTGSKTESASGDGGLLAP